MQLEIYTHITLVEYLYLKCNQKIHYINAQIHIEITINIEMQHIHEIPKNLQTVISTHMINP
jgi:hypothetical protein